VTAESLSVGDEVIASDGTTGRITALERINEPQMMYNLSVAVVATYLVGEGRWVVHNVRVGRWMNPEEYQAIRKTGVVQAPISDPAGGIYVTKVDIPGETGLMGFLKQASRGTIFVEFDIPDDTLLTLTNSNSEVRWWRIENAGTPQGRLYKRRTGNILTLPRAENITYVATRWFNDLSSQDKNKIKNCQL